MSNTDLHLMTNLLTTRPPLLTLCKCTNNVLKNKLSETIFVIHRLKRD